VRSMIAISNSPIRSHRHKRKCFICSSYHRPWTELQSSLFKLTCCCTFKKCAARVRNVGLILG
jgi:hypothetical protein